MSRIPYYLIYARLVAGPFILVLSLVQVESFPPIAVVLLIGGLLSDIFDGIIARKLNVSTTRLRRLDSNADQVFFLCVAAAAMIHCPEFLVSHWISLTILITFEALTYVVSYLKFKKEIASHSLGAKVWTLTLFASLVEILVRCESSWVFSVCFWLGLITRAEIMAISFTLKEWTHDVPTIFHAIRLRQGKGLTRNKLFNG